VGIRDRLKDWLDRPSTPDPDGWVTVTVVPFHEGPMVTSALDNAGIPAALQDWSPLPGQIPTRARIVVRQQDVVAAAELITDLRGSL
jgi:hypothetical protein